MYGLVFQWLLPFKNRANCSVLEWYLTFTSLDRLYMKNFIKRISLILNGLGWQKYAYGLVYQKFDRNCVQKNGNLKTGPSGQPTIFNFNFLDTSSKPLKKFQL
jgi:hypothetical protein